MRNRLSIGVFLAAVTVFPGWAGAQDDGALSPLQTQLRQMQSGEAYGMKTVSPAPPESKNAPPQLNDNAKALGNRAMAQQAPVRDKTRLEKLEAAYEGAKAPEPDRASAEKAIDKAVKESEGARKLRDAKMIYEGINMDAPKTPPRLIPVE